MAEVLKVLGQQIPPAATLTLLYTVPAATSAVVSSLVVCNQGGATTFRVSVAVNGAADDPKQYLYYDLPLAAQQSFAGTLGLSLGANDMVRCQAANGLVSFNLFGAQQ